MPRKLQRRSDHRKAMLANLVTSLIENERIETTLPRAKEAQRMAEKIITRAKKDSPHSRRQVRKTIRDRRAVTRLFEELGPRYYERAGGYTRILKLGQRRGDGAPLALLELVE